MNIRERVQAFWCKQRPDRIPYTIYEYEWRNNCNDPAWDGLFQKGLGVTWFLSTIRESSKNVTFSEKSYIEQGKKTTQVTMHTPRGDLCELYQDGWKQKYLLQDACDYAILTRVVQEMEIQPDYDNYFLRDQQIGEYGIALVAMGRTPMQTILVDYAGLEQFSYHLRDFPGEVLELYDALLNNYRKKAMLIAEGPGQYVSVLENFTAETMGPKRYQQYLMPVYQELFPMIQSSGKIIGTHYDGKLSACKKCIAAAPIDLIESFTPPPEGDMSIREAREIWPDKLLWSNINIDAYNLPARELKRLVLDRVSEGAPDGRNFAFEVSEQLPVNWRLSLAIVLDALQESAG